jgi:hypothetical protein
MNDRLLNVFNAKGPRQRLQSLTSLATASELGITIDTESEGKACEISEYSLSGMRRLEFVRLAFRGALFHLAMPPAQPPHRFHRTPYHSVKQILPTRVAFRFLTCCFDPGTKPCGADAWSSQWLSFWLARTLRALILPKVSNVCQQPVAASWTPQIKNRTINGLRLGYLFAWHGYVFGAVGIRTLCAQELIRPGHLGHLRPILRGSRGNRQSIGNVAWCANQECLKGQSPQLH